MPKILIIKTGSTLPSLLDKHGDFEDWIVAGMAVDPIDALIVDVTGGTRLPKHDRITHAIVTGSHTMITESPDWGSYVEAWLREAVARRVPTLGICFGHQLLAQALGGEVGDNPNGREFGTVEVRLADAAATDNLLGGFTSPIRVHASHTQSVLRLPDQARLLARNDADANQAFGIGECAWGMQFHPEFDAEIVAGYISHHRDELVAEGKDPDRLIQSCTDTPHGAEILRRFAGCGR